MTVVEAAFALPILLLFMFGLADIGMWVFNGNQASNAARDGARIAILAYNQADVSGSADETAIVDAIDAHLPGRTITAADVAIQCLDPDGHTVACATARVDKDRIQVAVDWSWNLVTPIAGIFGTTRGDVTGTSTMTIVGLPHAALPPASTTTTPPTSSTTSSTSTPPGSTTSTTTTTIPPCTASNLTVSPVAAKSNGRLQNDVTITWETNGVPDCSDLLVRIEAPLGGTASRSCGCGASPNHSWTYDKNANNFWTTSGNQGWVRVFNGSIQIAAKSFTVTAA